LQKQLAGVRGVPTPIMRELPEGKRRTTHIQLRGNYLDTGKQVTPGLPETFHPLPQGAELDRLGLAKWLVDENNPLTARVVINHFWEKVFGVGIVRTNEEFGSQGDPPTHPRLMDWLATEFMASGWDVKHMLKLMVTSAAYRQTSRVTDTLLERDPANRLLARGPRFRLPAETIRDQALAASGLLSDKMFGPPVKPPQPNLGLKAAFGSGIDWKTSTGEDRYRRGLYTTWRRSNPYPSMSTFDAPNREVCILRRDRTNTPLQALVTLNDPVYIEASQALARRVANHAGPIEEKVAYALRLTLSRDASAAEVQALVKLYDQARADFAERKDDAAKMATDPLGALPKGADAVDLAAWTVVANTLLNLDETIMPR